MRGSDRGILPLICVFQRRVPLLLFIPSFLPLSRFLVAQILSAASDYLLGSAGPGGSGGTGKAGPGFDAEVTPFFVLSSGCSVTV